jgi:hypothetical protein
MSVTVTQTKHFSFSSSDVQQIIADHIAVKFHITVDPKKVRLNVYGGDPGGYGSMGDPAHVYNSPTPASFSSAEVTVLTVEPVDA